MRQHISIHLDKKVAERIDNIAFKANVSRGAVIDFVFRMTFDESIDVCQGLTFNDLTEMVVRFLAWRKANKKYPNYQKFNNPKDLEIYNRAFSK